MQMCSIWLFIKYQLEPFVFHLSYKIHLLWLVPSSRLRQTVGVARLM